MRFIQKIALKIVLYNECFYSLLLLCRVYAIMASQEGRGSSDRFPHREGGTHMKYRSMFTRLTAALLVAVFLPTAALADNWYLEDGDITVSATESGQTVSQGDVTKEDSAPVIKNRDSSTSTTNNVTIKADTGATANVTLEDTNIDTTGGAGINAAGDAAVRTEGEGNVNLNVEQDNTLQSGDEHAGVEKDNGGNLTIGSESGSGQLVATGGDGGAGIGSGDRLSRGDYNVGNITITGGDIFATGNGGGAGIGGGWYCDASGITITGGNVTAEAKSESPNHIGGAGIGGGGWNDKYPGRGTNIKITGGHVTAIGGNYSAGIGGSIGSNGSDIAISDAEVIAIGGTSSAGIGGGCSTGFGGAGKGTNISISGSANVKAAGGVGDGVDGSGAAIGGGGEHYSNYLGAIDAPEGDADSSGLSPDGKVERFAPGTTFDIPQPKPRSSFYIVSEYIVSEENEPEQPAAAALYRVVDGEGNPLAVKTLWENGTLTLTADGETAVLEGTLSGLSVLRNQGLEIVCFTNGIVTVRFSLEEAIAKGAPTDQYRLTLSGSVAAFLLEGTEISGLLK